MSEHGDGGVVGEVRGKARELEAMLDDFGDRMRQRNRQLEDEIASFERDLDRLRREVLDGADEGGT